MYSASIVGWLVNELHKVPSPLVYVVAALLVFGEAALFVGFVLPGETTVIVAGVIAASGRVNIVALAALVVVAAIVGDSVGYAVGHRYGERLLQHRAFSRHRDELTSAMEGLRKRGPVYVFVGRFTAFLRAVMPGLAGMSKMHYRRFLVANALGGLVWGVAYTLLGYFSGTQLTRIEKYSSWVGYGLVALFLGAVGALWLRRRRRAKTTRPTPND
ncbi:MAG: DedA family protein [Acidobacteria bacterium]|jgi:membrane protein DedA with SNARE-associated domain|nr:DedA family protein [Acidobacteriota bacterium]